MSWWKDVSKAHLPMMRAPVSGGTSLTPLHLQAILVRLSLLGTPATNLGAHELVHAGCEVSKQRGVSLSVEIEARVVAPAGSQRLTLDDTATTALSPPITVSRWLLQYVCDSLCRESAGEAHHSLALVAAAVIEPALGRGLTTTTGMTEILPNATPTPIKSRLYMTMPTTWTSARERERQRAVLSQKVDMCTMLTQCMHVPHQECTHAP